MNGISIFNVDRPVAFNQSSSNAYQFGLSHCFLSLERRSAYTPVLRIQIYKGKIKSSKRIAIKDLDIKSALASAIFFIYDEYSKIDGQNYLSRDNEELYEALAWSQLDETEDSFIEMIYIMAREMNPSLLRKHGFNISDSITINATKYGPRYFFVNGHKKFKSMELKNAPTIRIVGQSYGKNAKCFSDLTEICAMFVAQNFYVNTVNPRWHHAYIANVFLHLNGAWQSKMIAHCSLPYRTDLSLTTFYNMIYSYLNDLKSKKRSIRMHVTKRRKQ